MRRAKSAVASACLFACLACGSTSKEAAADEAQVVAYQDLADRVQTAALTYRATMGGPGMTAAGCSAAHDAYDAQVRPWLSDMVQRSGAMDDLIVAHDGAGYADMGCVTSAMMADLDAHRLAACTFGTLSEDRAESYRHADVIASYGAHVYDRCGQMTGGLGGRGYMWGPMAPGCGTGGGPGGGTGGGSSEDPLVLGERVFDWGVGADGEPIVRTGGYGMMMSGCAGCHGSDGHGRRTMMFTTPDITYTNLTDPAGMREPDGSRGPTFTDELIHRAVVEGIDPDGDTLDTAMPRWQMSDQDWGNLLLFLKTLR